MDEVTQCGAALLEQAAALAHSLDEWATDLNEAVSALELVGERWSWLRRFVGRSERLRIEFKPLAIPTRNGLSFVYRKRRAWRYP